MLTFRFIGNHGIKPCLHSIAGNKEVNILEVSAFSVKCGMREVLFTVRNVTTKFLNPLSTLS